MTYIYKYIYVYTDIHTLMHTYILHESPGKLPHTCPCAAAIAGAAFPSLRSCTGSRPAPEPPLLKTTGQQSTLRITSTRTCALLNQEK